MFQLEESEGSTNAATYIGAAKGAPPIVNKGQRTIKSHTDCGEKREVTCQVARVNKILASIAGICDNGNEVTFRADGGTITHTQTKRETHFRRQGNVYVMDMWVRNPKFNGEPGKSMDFTRHGQGK